MWLYWLIVACEIAFWVVLALALLVRYVARRDRASRVLLYLLPAVDLLLLLFTAIDLRAGKTATFAHGLATAYVGFTVAFGSLFVDWADRRFAHWFAGGPAPAAAPEHGWAAVRYELMLWGRCIAAAAIIVVLLAGLIAFIDNDVVTQPLHDWFRIAAGSVVFWFLFGPVWSLVFFRRGT